MYADAKWLQDKGIDVHTDPWQLEYANQLFNPKKEAVFCEGKAGTGKTTLAILAGAKQVLDRDFRQLIYIRSPHTVGKELGFLEGSLANKQAPYMKPLMEAIEKAQPGIGDLWIKAKKLIMTTPTYERGVNYEDSFIVLDESQNYDMEEMQTILTRKHANSKVVVIGSLRQNDNRKGKVYGKTAFEWYMDHYRGDEQVAICMLIKGKRGWFADKADDIWLTVNAGQENLTYST